MRGALLLLLADALFLPAGLVSSAFLTRYLGPQAYGVYALAVSLGLWVEWSILAAFSRATIKFVGEHDDWQPVGATALRANLLAGTIAGIAVAAGAELVAGWMEEPALIGPLRAYAVALPIIAASSVHSQILVGRGDFAFRALISAVFAITRPTLIIGFVLLGFGPTGAVLGIVVASAVSLAIARLRVRPSLRRSDFGWQRLWDYAVAMFFFSICQRLLGNVDLVMLKLLGGSTTDAGLYGAAQNIGNVLQLIAFSGLPLLLSVLSRAKRAQQGESAQRIVGNAARLVLASLPLVAILAASASEVLALLSGTDYLAAAPLVPPLVFAAVLRGSVVAAATVLVAADRPKLPLWVIAPLVPVVIVANLLVIPAYGPLGAAMVTASTSLLAAIGSAAAVHRFWPLGGHVGTAMRSVLLTIVAYGLAVHWPVDGFWVLAKLGALGLAVLLGFALLGEIRRDDIDRLRSAWRQERAT